jgi:hypothetical protein
MMHGIENAKLRGARGIQDLQRRNWCLFDLRRHRDYSACTCTGAPGFVTVPGAITR